MPALHLKVGIGAWEKLLTSAVLGIGGLLWAGQGVRLLLGAQEGDKEASGVSGFTLDHRKPPGRGGGIAS